MKHLNLRRAAERHTTFTMARPIQMLWSADKWLVVLFYLSISLHSCGALAPSYCRRNEVPCPGKAKACVRALKICNGIKDCPDGSDEDPKMCRAYNCTNLDYEPGYSESETPYLKTSKCPSGNMCTKNWVFELNLFDATNMKFFVCSGGTKECVDGSDEDPKYCKNLDCSKIEFGFMAATCPSKKYCLYPKCYDCGDLAGDLLCDGTKDCPDGSDEWPSFCKKHGCSQNSDSTFRCKDGGCVKTKQICNGVKDCADGSDENSTFCVKYSCPWSDGRKCPGGRTCLRTLDTCDGTKNCPDGSDEDPAKCRKYKCPAGTWKCKDGVQCAYEKDRFHGDISFNDPRCNNIYECNDKSDESRSACAAISCTNRCPGSNACFYGRLCDGNVGCLDGSDETAAVCANYTCDVEPLVKCKIDNTCVFGGRCDGRVDCDDGSDEDAASCMKCPAGFWKCPKFPQCVYTGQLCDGNKDCIDGGDEAPSFCKNYKCPKVKCNLTCIEGTYCDGKGDCPDSSDENPSFCKSYKCPTDYSKCGDGKMCVNSYDLCRFDGRAFPVCNDKSESNLTFCRTFDCGASQGTGSFKCTSNSTKCFTSLQRCDGIVDCPASKSDEANCLTYKCPEGFVKCPDKSQCIPLSNYCDGRPDCKGGADEDKTFCTSYKCPTFDGVRYVKCPDGVRCTYPGVPC